MTIAVLGDVQSLFTAAYCAALSGSTVHLVRPEAPQVREVVVEGEARPVEVVVTHSLPAGPLEAVVIVAESRHLRGVIEPIAARLSGVPLLLSPGGFAGVLRVRAWFAEWGMEPPLVAEATGFPVSGTVADGRMVPASLKRGMPIASIDEESTARAHEIFVRLLPGLTPADLVTTSLSNTNHMIHPGVVLVNATRIDNGETFVFYRSGISPAVAPLLESVDAERVALARRLGAEALDVREWLLRFYAEEGMAGDDVAECLRGFEPFGSSSAPDRLDYRYLVDDIPFGAAQWAALAASLGVPTPRLEALLSTIQCLAPHLDLRPDPEAAQLFRQFLTPTLQGVPA